MTDRNHPLLTPEVMGWVGFATEEVALPDPISESDVRRYVAATGDANPIYRDLAAAKAAGYRERPIPPFLLVDLPMRAGGGFGNDIRYQVPLPPEYNDTRNGGNEVEFVTPAVVGDLLCVREEIVDIFVKEGRSGVGVWMVKEVSMRNDRGEVVLRSRQTSIRLPGGPKRTEA